MSNTTKWLLLGLAAVAGWWWLKNRSADKGTGAETGSIGTAVDPLLTSPVNPQAFAAGGLSINNNTKVSLQ